MTPFGAAALFSLAGFFILCVGGGGLEARQFLRARRYHEDIAITGTLIEGTITHIKGYKKSVGHNGDFDYYVRVTYEFETPRKKLLKHTTTAHRQDLANRNLSPIGTLVRVLYAHDYAYTIL